MLRLSTMSLFMLRGAGATKRCLSYIDHCFAHVEQPDSQNELKGKH